MTPVTSSIELPTAADAPPRSRTPLGLAARRFVR